jgi:hypothetical protein
MVKLIDANFNWIEIGSSFMLLMYMSHLFL